MPTYEYLCTECDTQHDIVQSMADATLTTCPSCGKESLRKQFTGVGVMFKGSGFYRTDSRSAESSSSPAKPQSDSTSSGSTESTGSKESIGSKESTTTAPTTPAAKPAAEKSAPKKSESSSGSASTS